MADHVFHDMVTITYNNRVRSIYCTKVYETGVVADETLYTKGGRLKIS